MNILELGYGASNNSAVVSGGEIFKNPDVTYFGMSLPDEWQQIKAEHFDLIKPVDAHWAAMPYKDNAFGAVLMRSCFGQFTHSWDSAASHGWSLYYGLCEVARVLEPGGKLFITEENTPEDLDKVIPAVVEAGLDVTVFEHETDREKIAPNSKYTALRAKYYGDMPYGFAGDGISRSLVNPRYALEAVKPRDREYIRERLCAYELLARRTVARGDLIGVDNGCESLEFLIASDADTLKEELRVAQTMVAVGGPYYDHWLKRVEDEITETGNDN